MPPGKFTHGLPASAAAVCRVLNASLPCPAADGHMDDPSTPRKKARAASASSQTPPCAHISDSPQTALNKALPLCVQLTLP